MDERIIFTEQWLDKTRRIGMEDSAIRVGALLFYTTYNLSLE